MRVRVREAAVKYANIKQIPFRPRVTLAVLYLVALGLIMTANTLSILGDFTPGYLAGLILQTVLLVHLIRRTGT